MQIFAGQCLVSVAGRFSLESSFQDEEIPMNPDAALADRRESVREAARAWLHAGWIDEPAFQRIEKQYPDDRVRAGIAFRILFFVLTLAAIGGLLGAVYSQLDAGRSGEGILATLMLAVGAGCAAITGYLVGPARRRQGGVEAAFSVAAVVNVLIALTILLNLLRIGVGSELFPIGIIFALVLGIAAWLWGYWPYMALSAVTLLAAVNTLHLGRLLWMILPLAGCRLLIAGWDSERLPPSLRKCSLAFLTVLILGLYAAANVFLHDGHYVFGFNRQMYFPRWLSIVLTAVIPCIVLGLGIIKRWRLFLVLGFAFSVCSLVTLRMYVHLAPLWIVLSGAGILLIASAGLLRHFLDAGAGRERGGFTAEPLTGQPEKHRALETLASVVTLTPEANREAPEGGFKGGGGEFGGGGASGKF
jgi:hypothetical protein